MSNTVKGSMVNGINANKRKVEESLNDIFIMRHDGKIAYLSHELYSDPSRIIESVNVDGTFEKRFFLNEDGVYPSNLSNPIVGKVIEWNLVDSNNKPKVFEADKVDLGDPRTGYFIDLRQLNMSRHSMIKLNDLFPLEADIPIADDKLPNPKQRFLGVPDDKKCQLSDTSEGNLYIAFYQEPDKTHSDTECYSYNVSYISAKELNDHLISSDSSDVGKQGSKLLDEVTINYLETYYGDAQVQAGGINPNDVNTIMLCLTCYVVNLKTFKP